MAASIENESERELVRWLGYQGWRVALSDGSRSVAAVAHATLGSDPVVLATHGLSQGEAVRRLLAAVAVRTLRDEPR